MDKKEEYETTLKILNSYSKKEKTAFLCLNVIFKLMDEIKRETKDKIQKNLLVKGYRIIGRCYHLNDNKYDISNKYIYKALELAVTNKEKALCNWDLGANYGNKNEIKKSDKHLKLAEEYYEKLNDMVHVCFLLNTRAWYTRKENLALKSIEICKKIYNMTDKEKDEQINMTYDTLVDIYIQKHDYFKAWNIFKKITNIKLRKRLICIYEKEINKQNKNMKIIS